MAKFLKQTASLERVKLDGSGIPVLNIYGEPEYMPAVIVKCRREKLIKDVAMASGATIKSSAQYFTVAEIGMNDKLDGKTVLTVEEYVNASGKVEGYGSVT